MGQPERQIAEAIQHIDRLLVTLEAIAARGLDEPSFERWRSAAIRGLASRVSQEEADRFQVETEASYNHYPGEIDDGPGRGDLAVAFLKKLREVLVGQPDIVSFDTPTAPVVTREGVFFAGQEHDALTLVHGIFAAAKKSLVIIDNFLGPPVLQILSAKQDGVTVRILTKVAKDDFLALARTFNKQHGGLSVAISKNFHDRFAFVDDADFYHFGASFKDVGGTGFMFSRIEEPSIVDALAKQFEAEWVAAKVLL